MTKEQERDELHRTIWQNYYNLHGKIENLNAHIAEIVIKQNHLRASIDEIVADLEGTLI